MRLTLVCALFACLSTASASSLKVQPTTTLAAETGNNTSASDSFAGFVNGDIAATNVSKMPIRSLLYPGSTTKIYAHFMPWFGGTNHANVGYKSDDPAQVERQVTDMASRGIDGAIIDWYGPKKNPHNATAIALMNSAELHPGFEFAINEDYGSVKSSADPTAQTISDLKYVYTTFIQSPAYMRINGRPVITFFGFEGQPVDIAAVKAALTFDPIFVFRNSGGFTKTASDGSYSWLSPLTSGYDNYMSLPYIDGFYKTGKQNPSQVMIGSAYKGFNDIIAAWSPTGGRHVEQYCGQTWLTSFAEAGKYFSESNQLPNLQIVTWNDYEEGTAVEMGIDNCVTVSASLSGSSLAWTITGNENTIDHYSVFISTDGSNLMPISDVAAGTHSLDLSQITLDAGTYQLFVKAVGKASMKNQMSTSISYKPAASSVSTSSADYQLSLAQATVQVAPGSTAQLKLDLTSVNAAYTSPVVLSCSNLPSTMKCSFSAASVVPGANGASTAIIIETATQVGFNSHSQFQWVMLPAFGIVIGVFRRKRLAQVIVGGLIIVSFVFAIGCGGSPSTTAPVTVAKSITTPPGSYNITISATSGTRVKTTTATVVVQ